MEPHLKLHNNHIYHTKYADVLTALRDFSGALSHYNSAIKLNPDSAKAREGLAKLEKRIANEEDEDEGGLLAMDEEDDGF